MVSGAVKVATSAADERMMRTVGLDVAAALEKRRLPGFQGVVAVTDEGVIVYISPSLDGRFGVDFATAVGRNFVEFVDLDDAGQAIDSFGGVLAKPGYHPALEIRVGPVGGDRTTVDVVAENCLDIDLAVVVMNLADSRERSMSAHLMNAQAEVVRQIALGGSLATAFESIAGFVATALPGFGAVAYVREGDCFVGWGSGIDLDGGHCRRARTRHRPCLHRCARPVGGRTEAVDRPARRRALASSLRRRGQRGAQHLVGPDPP